MGPVLVLIKCVFYGKFCVSSDKYVTIVVKTKCVNSGNMSNKLNFITNYTKFITTNTPLSKYTYILQFLILMMRRSCSRTLEFLLLYTIFGICFKILKPVSCG